MDCLNCGAELHKNDIFCINCETPVLTDDDLELMANMDFEQTGDALQDTITRSASDSIFDSLSLDEDEDSEEQHEEGELQDEYVRKNGGSRKAIIITASIVCAVIIGFGIFLWLRPSSAPPGESDPLPPVNDINNPDERPNENGTENTPPPDVINTVSAIEVLRGGRVQEEFHVSVGETVMLSARLIPEGASGDITWSSSDPEVIEVSQSNISGTDATIIGIGAGVADIIVTVGNIEERYVVFVDNMPVTMQLENALNDSDTAIWLTISWLDDDRFGQEIVFERDLDTQTWTLESAAERGEVEPTFGNEDGVITIIFPTSTKIYYLFDDSMGFYRNPDGTDSEDFMWWFKTSLVEPEG